MDFLQPVLDFWRQKNYHKSKDCILFFIFGDDRAGGGSLLVGGLFYGDARRLRRIAVPRIALRKYFIFSSD